MEKKDELGLEIGVSPYLTDTRMAECLRINCRYNTDMECDFKAIRLDVEGRCVLMEGLHGRPRTLDDPPRTL